MSTVCCNTSATPKDPSNQLNLASNWTEWGSFSWHSIVVYRNLFRYLISAENSDIKMYDCKQKKARILSLQPINYIPQPDLQHIREPSQHPFTLTLGLTNRFLSFSVKCQVFLHAPCCFRKLPNKEISNECANCLWTTLCVYVIQPSQGVPYQIIN